MNSKRMELVAFCWILMAFCQQTLNGEWSILWTINIMLLSLYHLKIIKIQNYKFYYLIILLVSASVGWFFEENPSDKIFFWSLFWWIQISLASLSTLFLICKRNAQSSTWHTSTACVALFFSFYLWTGDYPWVQMIAAWIGFLFIASPRATHKPIRQATYFLWLILAILGTSTFYFWKTYYPNYQNWVYKNFYQHSAQTKGFQWDMKIGGMSQFWDESKDNEVLIYLWGNKAPSHLKGVSYSFYKKGQWFSKAQYKVLRPSGNQLEYQFFNKNKKTKVTSQKIMLQNHRDIQEAFFIPQNWNAIGVLDDSVKWNKNDYVIPYDRYSSIYYLEQSESHTNLPKPLPSDLQIPDQIKKALIVFNEKHNLLKGKLYPFQLKQVFQSKFTYTLTPPNTKGDPIDFFLNQSQKGYCEYFASASVMLLRYYDIPARLAKGFAYPTKVGNDGQWVYRRGSAHAWVEYWIDDRWKVLDPTPPLARPLISKNNWLESWLESVKFKFLRWQNILFYGEWKLALESFKYWFQTNLYSIILSIIAFVAMVLILLRFVHKKQITNWEKQIAQIEKTLEKYGYKRQSHQTIEEWGQQINWDKLPLAESKALKDSWEYYTQNRFSK